MTFTETITNVYLLMGIFGLFGLGMIIRQLLNRNISLSAGLVGFLLFCGMVSVSTKTLFSDYLEPSLVLEGRVDNLQRTYHKGELDYLVDIDGQTVNVTPSMYEQLMEKGNPLVRAEVGRGSNYILKIEYLAN